MQVCNIICKQICKHAGMKGCKNARCRYAGEQEYKFASMHYTRMHLWTHVSKQVSMFVLKQKFICKYESLHVCVYMHISKIFKYLTRQVGKFATICV